MKTLVTLAAGTTISLLVAAPALAQTTDDRDGFPWWGWLLVAVILAAALFVLGFWERWAPSRDTSAVPEPPAADTTQPATLADIEPDAADDLTRIEGIGPKIASVLGEAGITTFAALAQTDVSNIRALLDAPNLRIADPTSWPEQAALAAAGKWDELERLQGTLTGGRSTEPA